MAKESLKAREVKRAKLIAKYADKRAELKKIINGDDYELFVLLVGVGQVKIHSLCVFIDKLFHCISP